MCMKRTFDVFSFIYAHVSRALDKIFLYLLRLFRRFLTLWQVRDWLRDDLDFGDGEEGDEDDEDGIGDAEDDEEDGVDGGGNSEGEARLETNSALPKAAKSKVPLGAKAMAVGGGRAEKAPSGPSSSKGKTLGDSIKDVALKVGWHLFLSCVRIFLSIDPSSMTPLSLPAWSFIALLFLEC